MSLEAWAGYPQRLPRGGISELYSIHPPKISLCKYRNCNVLRGRNLRRFKSRVPSEGFRLYSIVPLSGRKSHYWDKLPSTGMHPSGFPSFPLSAPSPRHPATLPPSPCHPATLPSPATLIPHPLPSRRPPTLHSLLPSSPPLSHSLASHPSPSLRLPLAAFAVHSSLPLRSVLLSGDPMGHRLPNAGT